MKEARPVGVGERVCNLDARSTARRGFNGRPAMVFQRLARHELTHEEQLILVLADFVERGDVRVRERRRGPRIGEELRTPLGVSGDRRRR